MRLTVCELPDVAKQRDAAWAELTHHLQTAPTDVLVLPEMPFVDWTVFTKQAVDPAVWKQALADHDAMISRFSELQAAVVLASRPVEHGGRRLNQGFAWTRESGSQSSRSKVYLPNAPDGWEATWFDRGDLDPSPLTVKGLRVGFQLCTEMLFTDLSWRIGRAGVHLIAAPRATGGHRRWKTAASLMAIVSGCFVASANRRSYGRDDFVGQSWIISPEGEFLAETSAQAPFATVEISLEEAESAKQTYPRSLSRE
ncbi:MAG TPA: carbon-nitrogen hydrolase family protein [Patescibacteria group bacterium]|nr:carbon-nitrogen hydrolase family protein [Patescibacteria group bacterium]